MGKGSGPLSPGKPQVAICSLEILVRHSVLNMLMTVKTLSGPPLTNFLDRHMIEDSVLNGYLTLKACLERSIYL